MDSLLIRLHRPRGDQKRHNDIHGQQKVSVVSGKWEETGEASPRQGKKKLQTNEEFGLHCRFKEIHCMLFWEFQRIVFCFCFSFCFVIVGA